MSSMRMPANFTRTTSPRHPPADSRSLWIIPCHAHKGTKVVAVPILAGCTMTTERWLKEETSEQILHERTQGCQSVIVVCQDPENKTFSLHPSGFLERILQASTGWSCLMEPSSRATQREEQVPLVLPLSAVPRETSYRGGEIILWRIHIATSQYSRGKKVRLIVQNKPIS